MTRLVRMLLLLVVWLALWSDVTVANVVSGIVASGAIVVVFDTWRHGTVAIRPLKAARFTAWFLFQLAWASITVSRAVLAPRGRIRTGIVAVPLSGCSDAVATLIADAISLTPGTLTLEVRQEPLTLYVHALDVRDVDAVRCSVRTLERLAIEAFGDDAAIAGLAVDDTTSRRTL